MALRETLFAIAPLMVFHGLVMWLALGRLPARLFASGYMGLVLLLLALLGGVIFFPGLYGVLALYGIWLGLALGYIRARWFARASRMTVLVGIAVAMLLLAGASPWFWSYYGHDGPVRASYPGGFDEFMGHTRTVGRLVYLLPAIAGLLASVITALYLRAHLAHSLAFITGALLVLVASPLLMWFDFVTSCSVGGAIFMTWSSFC